MLCGRTSTLSSTRFCLLTGSPDPFAPPPPPPTGPFVLPPSESLRLLTGAAAALGGCGCGGGGLSFLSFLSGSPAETGGGGRRGGWPASRSGRVSGCEALAEAGDGSWPEWEAVVSPENLGRKPVRLAQVEGGTGEDSGAGSNGPGLGPGFGSELDMIFFFFFQECISGEF